MELTLIPLEGYERKLVIASTPFLFSPGKYLDGRAVIFPFSYAVFLYCSPENRGACLPLMFLLSYPFIIFFHDPRNFLLGQGCQELCSCCCIVSRDVLWSSTQPFALPTQISVAPVMRKPLEDYGSWERQQQRTTAGPSRMRAAVYLGHFS